MGKSWTKEDIDFLKQWYPKYGAKYCSNMINRTLQSIRCQATKLNLKSGRWTDKQKEEKQLTRHNLAKEKFKKMGLNLIGEYINTRTNTAVECPKCNKIYYPRPGDVFSGKSSKCIDCYSIEKKGKPQINLDEEINKKYNSLTVTQYISCEKHTIVECVCDCGGKYVGELTRIKSLTVKRCSRKCPIGIHPSLFVNETNKLSFARPDIASEWDFKKNFPLTPNDITFCSGRKVFWICSKCSFEYQAQCSNRKNGSGCPKCYASKGELKIEDYLLNMNIKHKREYKDILCKYKRPLRFDFAIWINKKLAFIEYNGEQHYKIGTINWNCTEKQLKLVQKRDKIKEDYCKDNNIPLLVIPYWDKENIESILNAFIGESNDNAGTS